MRDLQYAITNERSQGEPLLIGRLLKSAIFNAPMADVVSLLNFTPDSTDCAVGKQNGSKGGDWLVDNHDRATDFIRTDLDGCGTAQRASSR